jgi:hypothetical protein
MRRRYVLGLIGAALLASDHAEAQRQEGDWLVGVWRGQMPGPLGPMQMELILMPNRTYTAAAYSAGVMTRHWGTWRSFPGILRLDIEGAQPREWCGPRGCTPLHWPVGETWQYDMPDRNTIRTANGVMRRVG